MKVTHSLFASALAASALTTACARLDPAADMARQRQRLATVLEGRVAGPAMNCLPSYRNNGNTEGIGPDLVFDDGATVYVSHTAGGCEEAGHAGYILVTRPFNGSGLCSGDLARLVTTSGGIQAGSCSVGEFVPYRKP